MAAFLDLNMIPAVAGAVVMACNISGMQNLNLILEAIVGFHNGTITRWDDPVIANLNPTEVLPTKDITVIAREDKSGTTEGFISGLSAHSSNWKHTYGTFTEGLDKAARQHSKWNNDTIKFFGQTNRGMSGLMPPIYYSICYVSIATAHLSGINYATLIISAGNLVNTTVETIQNAVISANGSFAIINKPATFAYPLAAYTYLIIKMTTMLDCYSAVELARYVEWFYSSEKAQDEPVKSHMVPLDNATAKDIVTNVLKVMTCRGNNIGK